jgi:glycosyltransferase involved in cell wall biosynthesis
MTVTVGIATAGEDPNLRTTVESSLRSAALLAGDAEVLVVLNGEGRAEGLVGIDSPMLRVRRLDRRNVSLARNAILDEARHDTILFVDDDCLVAPEWCAQLAAALDPPEVVAVGAPVEVPVVGPVTAYADYHRMYNAFPFGPGGPQMLVTTNCGLRRDRVPRGIRFDTTIPGNEDTGFALQLGRAGLATRWIDDATPVVHGFGEDIRELTGRFGNHCRYAVRQWLLLGQTEAAIPGALWLYRQRIREDFRYQRGFVEFVDAPVRTAFVVYDAIAAAVSAVSYLDELGNQLGQPLVAYDRPALDEEWLRVGELVRQCTAELSTSDWAGARPDYPGMPGRLGGPEPLLVPLLAQVRTALRRFAPPVPDDPGGRAGDVLNYGLSDGSARYLELLQGCRRMYDELCAGPQPVTRQAIERGARALGLPLPTALDAIEVSLRARPPRHAGGDDRPARAGQGAAVTR